MPHIDDAFHKLGPFFETEIDALIEIADGIPTTLIEEKIGEKIYTQSRREAAKAMLNWASRHSAGTMIRIDGKELSPTKQKIKLKAIKVKSAALCRDMRNIWVRDNWNFAYHLGSRGIREELEKLFYLLDNVHYAAESALQDLEPIKKKKELTNASKTARAEFMSALFKVWENIFEKEITLGRTSETQKSKGNRPCGKLVNFILKAGEIAKIKPALTRWVAEDEIRKQKSKIGAK